VCVCVWNADKEKTCIKLICHGDDQKVIGLHILGKGADECMQGFVSITIQDTNTIVTANTYVHVH
jgi:glutathione reductase (NADPH)